MSGSRSFFLSPRHANGRMWRDCKGSENKCEKREARAEKRRKKKKGLCFFFQVVLL